jgi:hypoxanthine phosphoribosyltransferase
MSRTNGLPQELDLGSVVFDRDQIHAAVERMAAEISADFAGARLLVVGVLPGAVLFLADLVRSLSTAVETDLIALSRFGPPDHASARVRILKDLEADVRGRPVLLVEDIVDTGLTLHHLISTLIPRGPSSVQAAALLERPQRRLIRIPLTYVGFQAPDDFLVGYGLQHQGQYRQLPFIARLPEEALASPG